MSPATDMFRRHKQEPSQPYGLVMIFLLLFSLASLGVTIWVMVDLLHEQEIVNQLLRKLPVESKPSAIEMAGELRWQFRLSILVALNLLATGMALVLLWRAYRISQESLRDIRALAGDILSSVDQAVITTDLAGRITSINNRGLKFFNQNISVVGQPITQLTEQIPFGNLFQEVHHTHPVQLTKDFKYLPVGKSHLLRLKANCDILRGYHNRQIGHIIQLRDVTEMALIDERMQRMERFLELGSLSVGLHHEIKNPLTALSLHSQLLSEELQHLQLETPATETLQIMRQEIARIEQVLESFRDFASLEKLQISTENMTELVEKTRKLMMLEAQQKNIRLDLELPPVELPQVEMDQVKIEQVLINLLKNAFEAMPQGGMVTIRLGMLTTKTGPEKVILTVQDTGNGIPEHIIHRIFDPYFTTKGAGTGMGLALCEKIVRQHEGSLDVSSSSTGSVFVVTLPTLLTKELSRDDDD
ncbi:MAG: ATP-binding protein [Planctomycetaceae bacterium]|nr:GHKL domain-containing protein [Planctomycetaceae bacterium]